MTKSNSIIGFIGCGSMGGALVQAMVKQISADNILVSAAHYEHAQKLAEKTGCIACKTNIQVAEEADILFLAVKPLYMTQILHEIKGNLKNSVVVVSMAAGITLERLSADLPDTEIIRIMPNMPAAVGEAMTALCCTDGVKAETVACIAALLSYAGKVETVPEKLMDCVTAVSGSGPAYAFIFIEAMADAAVRFGMPRRQAYIYAAQTLKGAAAMVLTDERCPGALKDAVCSPAGTTIEGVAALEKAGFRSAVIDAVTAAHDKAAAMKK
jgi:pyrroline-5-carboxylate reductase